MQNRAIASLCVAATLAEGAASNATNECWTRMSARLSPIVSSSEHSSSFNQLVNASSPFFPTGTFSTRDALNNSKVCQQWYIGVEDAIKKVDPPCTIAVANGTQIVTAKWNASLSEFMEASEMWVADVSEASEIPTKAPSTTATKPVTISVTTMPIPLHRHPWLTG
ncbi:hypothetical protein H310_02650 [Aphanomyces invadans]|uniref:SCP domain-containing protein n=1 Tax=Aphanomyces invadans TaxID=157072 RepID=A0A024UJA4_9STRA|nr:hypothetical protein H310_02650 [Aphanomyces invadans]ETW06374.1 hypothetical protein H310_02650 [Aphanomyces invadans]|eukprot:XP_008864449.1 hypothetical protein H310_02650 [Aphanomyces invadans]